MSEIILLNPNGDRICSGIILLYKMASGTQSHQGTNKSTRSGTTVIAPKREYSQERPLGDWALFAVLRRSCILDHTHRMERREHHKLAPTQAQHKPVSILSHFDPATVGTIGNLSG